MRYLEKQSIEDIALGASLLGAGGGGDPYIGKLMALTAVEKYGPVQLLSVDEVPDDVLVISSSMMGAPSVQLEKFLNGNEYNRLMNQLTRYLGEDVYATYPIEAGGLNSMIPIAAAARLGLPMVDCDGIGRAFPELQMTTFGIYGIQATPLAITDEKGNMGILETIDNDWTESIARTITDKMGAAASLCSFPIRGSDLKRYSVQNTVSYSENIGRTIRELSKKKQASIQTLLKVTAGYHILSGKIVDVSRSTKNGFNYGKTVIEGLDQYKYQRAEIYFQNENIVLKHNGKAAVTAPDLICLVDLETLTPMTNEGLKYGKRVHVIGLPCDPKWRTPKGLELVGPRYFGYDLDYVPLEQAVKC